ncbi:hypothetical protein A2U01_0076416, partial [Trifolium medium]|nr:hypothetical protein [Trifolium medium]
LAFVYGIPQRVREEEILHNIAFYASTCPSKIISLGCRARDLRLCVATTRNQRYG